MMKRRAEIWKPITQEFNKHNTKFRCTNTLQRKARELLGVNCRKIANWPTPWVEHLIQSLKDNAALKDIRTSLNKAFSQNLSLSQIKRKAYTLRKKCTDANGNFNLPQQHCTPLQHQDDMDADDADDMDADDAGDPDQEDLWQHLMQL